MNRIVVIGASSGLGRLVAIAYAERGWSVGIAARRVDRLQEVAARFPKQIITRAIDVTSDNAPDEFKSLINDLGGMDILFYAAGCGWYNPSLDPKDEQRTIAVNVKGFTAIIDTAYHFFKESKSKGCIAAITSIGGTRGLGVSASYSATKRYQWTYLQALDQLAHNEKTSIDIVELRPGFVRTELIDRGPQHLPMTMAPEYAVERIIKALDRRKRVTVVDWRWAIVSFFWRLLPRSLWRIFPVTKIMR